MCSTFTSLRKSPHCSINFIFYSSDRDELKETLTTKEKEFEQLKQEMSEIRSKLEEKEKNLKGLEEQLETQMTTNKDLQGDIKILS